MSNDKVSPNKVVRDGRVAVLVSSGYGAGWSSWIGDRYKDYALFDAEVVALAERGADSDAVEEHSKAKFGEDYYCLLGWSDVKVEWVQQGQGFYVHEYDGNEWLVTEADDEWHIA